MGDAKPSPSSLVFRLLCGIAGGSSLVLSLIVGSISDMKRGCENTTIVAAGSPEGEVYVCHGAPDRIIDLGNSVGPNIRRWNRYMVEWRMEETHKMFVTASARRMAIAYLIENGKVVNGSFVGEGEHSGLLGQPVERSERAPGTWTQVSGGRE